jgi:DNA-binding XRE family transcriptional regulator
MVITAAQIRAARGLLGWTQAQLAANSGLSEIGIQNIEKGASDPRSSTLQAIERAFEIAGVEFTNGGHPGVRMKGMMMGNRVKFRPGSRLRPLFHVGLDEIGVVTGIVDDGTALPRVNVKFLSCEVKGAVAAEFVPASDAPDGVRLKAPSRSINDGVPKGYTLDPLEADRDPFETVPARVTPKRPGPKRRGA